MEMAGWLDGPIKPLVNSVNKCCCIKWKKSLHKKKTKENDYEININKYLNTSTYHCTISSIMSAFILHCNSLKRIISLPHSYIIFNAAKFLFHVNVVRWRKKSQNNGLLSASHLFTAFSFVLALILFALVEKLFNACSLLILYNMYSTNESYEKNVRNAT